MQNSSIPSDSMKSSLASLYFSKRATILASEYDLDSERTFCWRQPLLQSGKCYRFQLCPHHYLSDWGSRTICLSSFSCSHFSDCLSSQPLPPGEVSIIICNQHRHNCTWCYFNCHHSPCSVLERKWLNESTRGSLRWKKGQQMGKDYFKKKHPKLRKLATHRAEHGKGLWLAPLQLVATSQTFGSCCCSSKTSTHLGW